MSGTYSVGEVARLARITIRTLHHYDQIGLLTPCVRGTNGYRRYDGDNLDRLQRILFYRELELPLEDIQALLDGDDDPLDHLRHQHQLLLDRCARLDRLVRTLEQTMNARKMGVNLTPEEMLEVFGDFDPGDDVDEAEERWGDTDAWRQSTERHRTYTKADYQRMADETTRLNERFAEALDAGEPADAVVAMDLAEEAREQIDHWHSDLNHAGHRSLPTMYVEDLGFAAYYNVVHRTLHPMRRAS